MLILIEGWEIARFLASPKMLISSKSVLVLKVFLRNFWKFRGRKVIVTVDDKLDAYFDFRLRGTAPYPYGGYVRLN